MVGQAEGVGLGRSIDRLARRDVECREDLLRDPEVERDLDVDEAAAACPRDHRPQRRVEEDPAVRPGDIDDAVEGLDEAQIIVDRDRDPGDLVRPLAPGRLAEKAGERKEHGLDAGHR